MGIIFRCDEFSTTSASTNHQRTADGLTAAIFDKRGYDNRTLGCGRQGTLHKTELIGGKWWRLLRSAGAGMPHDDDEKLVKFGLPKSTNTLNPNPFCLHHSVCALPWICSFCLFIFTEIRICKSTFCLCIGSCFEVKTEADSNDVTECSPDDKWPIVGMFRLSLIQFALSKRQRF